MICAGYPEGAYPRHMMLCERLDHLALRRDVASLCDIIPTIWMCGGPPQCGFQEASFHVLQSCGMSFLGTIRHSLKAGNAPVIPLVLQEIVSGGDHLTLGDP
ncbi:unnamed protein product [Leptidea sinapis]|uniref:Uncharacterized protein n=1 Tax=Leptidea sinapis TaxID=189913 RepID=A0A5E4QE50_9NEOP|nr:unnamed protein product [Leptidea sinapis]